MRVNPTVSPTPLRPLGLGELLDKAVTLCVTYFVPFSLIYVAYAVPLGIVTFFASRRNTLLVEAFTDQLRARAAGHPGDPNAMSSIFADSSPTDALWSVGLIAMWFFLAPLVSGALIDATTETYLGRVASISRAYRVAVSRWLPLLVINVLYALIGAALYLIAVIGVIVVVFALAAITAFAHALGIAVDIIVGILVVASLLAFLMLALLAYQLSFFACVVEGAGPITAFTRGIGRIASGIGVRRALLVGLAYLAVSFAIFLVSLLGQGIIVGLLHSAIAGAVFSTIVGVATAAFLTAFMTIFYFDLRVREEGLDLQLAAQAALTPPGAE